MLIAAYVIFALFPLLLITQFWWANWFINLPLHARLPMGLATTALYCAAILYVIYAKAHQ